MPPSPNRSSSLYRLETTTPAAAPNVTPGGGRDDRRRIDLRAQLSSHVADQLRCARVKGRRQIARRQLDEPHRGFVRSQ